MLNVLLVSIASHMSYKTICVASTVCRNWRQVFGDILWEQPLTVVAKHPNTAPLVSFLEAHKHKLHYVVVEYAQPGTYYTYKEILKALVGAANLHTLSVRAQITVASLPHSLRLFTRENWTALQHLVLYGPNSNMKPLCQGMASQLISLHLRGTHYKTNQTWCTDTTWELLETLSFHKCWRNIVQQITMTPFDSLKHLYLIECSIDDDYFESIVRWIQFPYLETLNLSGNLITDNGIKQMCELLNDQVTPIDSDKNPWREVYWGWVENLVELDLSNNPLTKRSLNYLGYITHPHFSGLTKLNIKGIHMTKKAVDYLCECEFADQLSDVIIGENNISTAMLERLRTKLPNCHIKLA
jgi:hypothetical protein